MGERLVREALEYAKSPDALTTPERMWLVKQAADADDETRVCAKSRSEYGWDEMLADLLHKGALKFDGEQVVFTGMGLSDARWAYQEAVGIKGHHDEDPSAFWYH